MEWKCRGVKLSWGFEEVGEERGRRWPWERELRSDQGVVVLSHFRA